MSLRQRFQVHLSLVAVTWVAEVQWGLAKPYAVLYLLPGLSTLVQLKRFVGNAYRPIMGIPSGHYIINLEDKWDRIAIRKLAELNNREQRGLSAAS